MDIHTDDNDPFLPSPPTPRRGPGRPPSTRSCRSRHLALRLLPSEKLRLTAAAKRAGYDDTSSWARGVLLAECAGETLPVIDHGVLAEVARLRRDLNSGIGANLNQALLHANRAAKGLDEPDETELVREVRFAQDALATMKVELQRLLKPAGRP